MVSSDFLEKLWHGDHPLSLVLAPFGWLYCLVTIIRKLAYSAGVIPVRSLSVPVIVVGNITVGGTGKTPLVIWLAGFLKSNGYRPGIVSRGYGGRAKKWPQQVRPDSNPGMVGDEPVLIARRTGLPVAVCPDRYIAARELLEHTDCDIILCDDGLQHLKLRRNIEIAVVDGDRRFGNGRCLPAGPLREPAGRIKTVDMVISNGKAAKNEYLMEYDPKYFVSVNDPEKQCSIDSFRGATVHAVAGIGNPDRFYSFLRSREIRIIKHEFPDHFDYQPENLKFNDNLPVVMTEKDAVKCMSFANEDLWYLFIDAKLPNTFEYRLSSLLKENING